MTRSLVTICVPAYNAGRYIGACLRSLVAQTYPHREIIVSDNASTDDTADIARPFAEEGVRYTRTERNLGGPANFNRCLALGEGELVAVYHADDVYHPRIVEEEVRYLAAHPDAAAVLALDWWMNERGEVWGGTSLPEELCGRDTYRFGDLFPALLRHTNSFLRAPTAMVRRAVCAEVGGWDAGSFPDAADLDLWLRLSARGGIGILERRLVRYRVSATQWSTASERGRTRPADFFQVMDHYLARLDARPLVGGDDLVRYAAHRRADVVVRALHLAARGGVAEAAALLRVEFAAGPALGRRLGPRVRAHLIAGLVLGLALRVGVGRPAAMAMLAIRASGIRSFLRERAPGLALGPFRRRELSEWGI